MAIRPPLTNALDSTILKCVRRWVEVVFRQQKKCGQLDPSGRPWSRIPAKDLVVQVEREQEGLQVSVRSIQRSLARLERMGYICRQQRSKGWWKRDYWYSWTDTEWEAQKHRPSVVSRRSPVSSRKDPSHRNEATGVSSQYLGNLSSNQNSSRPERKTALEFDEGGACVPPQEARRPRTHLTPFQTLHRVVQRATARGFGATSTQNQVPQPPKADTWVADGFRFTRMPSGLVVKDDLATAPLR